jgi:hypothetical protein
VFASAISMIRSTLFASDIVGSVMDMVKVPQEIVGGDRQSCGTGQVHHRIAFID